MESSPISAAGSIFAPKLKQTIPIKAMLRQIASTKEDFCIFNTFNILS